MSTIIFFTAHNDDSIIGAGGTIAKYSKEGKKVLVFVFSYGENSLPHIKRELAIKKRISESKKSDEILGCKSFYFGVKEGNFIKEKDNLKKKVKEILKKYKPKKIFTHSFDDPHPDHMAVHKIVLEVYDSLKLKCGLFAFPVWNIITLHRRNAPKLFVDISSSFSKKVRAFKMHKSQKVSIVFLLWSIYFKAKINGIENNCKYAELFYRIR